MLDVDEDIEVSQDTQDAASKLAAAELKKRKAAGNAETKERPLYRADLDGIFSNFEQTLLQSVSETSVASSSAALLVAKDAQRNDIMQQSASCFTGLLGKAIKDYDVANQARFSYIENDIKSIREEQDKAAKQQQDMAAQLRILQEALNLAKEAPQSQAPVDEADFYRAQRTDSLTISCRAMLEKTAVVEALQPWFEKLRKQGWKYDIQGRDPPRRSP